MEAETTDKKSKWSGIPMTDGELKEAQKVWEDIDENIKLVYEKGKNI